MSNSKNICRLKPSVVIHWFRRDLRLNDNTALLQALNSPYPVLPLFIFDTNILNTLEKPYDRRVYFIYCQLEQLYQQFTQNGKAFLVKIGTPQAVWQELSQTFDLKAVYANRDYEPYAQQRDQDIYNLLAQNSIQFKGSKDHVIFDKNEVVKSDGKPYTVFTPYSRRWLDTYTLQIPTVGRTASPTTDNFWAAPPYPFPDLKTLGFCPTDMLWCRPLVAENMLQKYADLRNFPAQESGTSRLSVHFRFGTISIREMAQKAWQHSPSWLNELIWRDFYQQILYHFPHIVHKSFKPEYDQIEWRNKEADFIHWCNGTTGYPIVDAGMRELNETGYMHNRVRMITASFLTKHLLIDWRWGEAYFAQKLIDFDLAANNGGWQWAASSGCDAVPYFRIFNPTLQQGKFDKLGQYIQKWLPEYGTSSYPTPIVAHEFARNRAIETYKRALRH